MIDPITAAKTAAIVAGLAVNVLGYMAKVRDAPRRAQQLRDQLGMTQHLAEGIEQLLKTNPQLPVAPLEQAMTQLHAILDELEERTRPANAAGIHKYLWPFNEDETERYLSDIEHYKSAFNAFFALHNFTITREIYGIIKSRTPVPTDAASETSVSQGSSLYPGDRRPSSVSQISSSRLSIATTQTSYIDDIIEEFKKIPEESPPHYQKPALIPVNTKIYQLLNAIDPKPTIQLVALSVSGERVVLLSQYSFWVFETRYGTLVNSRVSPKEKKKPKGFKRRSKEPPSQVPDRAFHCAALGDKFLAVGVDDMIMVFGVEEGKNTDRAVFCDEFECTNPERLKFSANGEQLAGVLRDTGEDRTQVLIYSTANFSDPPSEIIWEDSPYSPNDIAFSTDGNMIAICSSPSGSRAEFRILRKFQEEWRKFLVHEEELFGRNDRVGLGFTGITFCPGNRKLAMSVDTPAVKNKDNYRIVADQRGRVSVEIPKNEFDNVMSGLRGVDNWAIAVSEYGIALVSKKGLLRIKHPASNQWDSLGRDKNRAVTSPNHLDLLFSNTENRLLFVDREGTLEIYDFEGNTGSRDVKWKGIEFKLHSDSSGKLFSDNIMDIVGQLG